MFPLADPKGHVLGFGARALSPDDQPKYLNTSESELFHKGRLVYGADLARAAAARAGRLVLVEGYTDVIALRQAGIPETVCSMGTALTDRQLDALKRLTPKVLLCQDPDAAGQEAVAKGKDAIRAFNESHRLRGFDLRVVRLPPGQDPADVVQREGAEAMRALLETSVPVAAVRGRARARRAPTSGRPRAARTRCAPSRRSSARLDPGAAAVRPDPARRQPAADAGGDDPGGAAPRAAVERPRAAAAGAGGVRRPRSTGARTPSARSSPAASRSRTPGRRALEEMDIDASFSIELTRRAAHYLAEHLEHPGQSLPAGADDLARLVAELVIRAGDLAADPDALELERLQLDKHRLDRADRRGRRAGEPVAALAAERQRVQHEYEHRQSANLSCALRAADRDGQSDVGRDALARLGRGGPRCARSTARTTSVGVRDADEAELGVVGARRCRSRPSRPA